MKHASTYDTVGSKDHETVVQSTHIEAHNANSAEKTSRSFDSVVVLCRLWQVYIFPQGKLNMLSALILCG